MGGRPERGRGRPGLRAGVLVALGGDIATAGRAPTNGWGVLVRDRAEVPVAPVTPAAHGALATSSTVGRTWSRGTPTTPRPVVGLPRRGGPADRQRRRRHPLVVAFTAQVRPFWFGFGALGDAGRLLAGDEVPAHPTPVLPRWLWRWRRLWLRLRGAAAGDDRPRRVDLPRHTTGAPVPRALRRAAERALRDCPRMALRLLD